MWLPLQRDKQYNHIVHFVDILNQQMSETVKLRETPKVCNTKHIQKCICGQVNSLGYSKNLQNSSFEKMDNPQPTPAFANICKGKVNAHRLNDSWLLHKNKSLRYSQALWETLGNNRIPLKRKSGLTIPIASVFDLANFKQNLQKKTFYFLINLLICVISVSLNSKTF
jgi:hypothetical protein